MPVQIVPDNHVGVSETAIGHPTAPAARAAASADLTNGLIPFFPYPFRSPNHSTGKVYLNGQPRTTVACYLQRHDSHSLTPAGRNWISPQAGFLSLGAYCRFEADFGPVLVRRGRGGGPAEGEIPMRTHRIPATASRRGAGQGRGGAGGAPVIAQLVPMLVFSPAPRVHFANTMN